MTELTYRPGDRLCLNNLWGTVAKVNADGVVFLWDEPYKLYSHGATARQWFLSYGHVTELERKTPPVSGGELPEVCRACH